MSRKIFKSSVIALAAVASIPCSSDLRAAPPEKEVGTFDLNFLFSGELVLWAHIESASGECAGRGRGFPVLLLQGATT